MPYGDSDIKSKVVALLSGGVRPTARENEVKLKAMQLLGIAVAPKGPTVLNLPANVIALSAYQTGAAVRHVSEAEARFLTTIELGLDRCDW